MALPDCHEFKYRSPTAPARPSRLPRVQIPFLDCARSGHEDVTTYQNVVYSVEILYPEAMFELICLNLLIERRHAFHS